MKWPTALLGSACVIAVAVVAAAFSPAISQQRGAGFMMAAGSSTFAWRVNTVTGAVSYCVRRSDSTDPSYIQDNPPACSGFSPPAQ